MKKAYDINPGVGGPLLREKLWFYSSARWQANQNYIAGLYYNKNEGDPTKWLYEQDTTRRGFFSLEQNGINTRLTWQAAQKHKIAFYYDYQSRIWDDTRAGVSPESAVAYRFPVLNLAQASWTTPLTNKLLVEVRYANRGEAFGNQLPADGLGVSRHGSGARAVDQLLLSRQGRRRRRQRTVRLLEPEHQHARRRRCPT